MYAHCLVLARKDQPVQLLAHPAPDSQPVTVPFSVWHVAAND